MTVGIYILKNKINDKCYVGQSWYVEKRLKEHASSKENQVITHAIKKYGWKNFNVKTIPVPGNIDQNALNLLECQHIISCNSSAPNGYNIKEGGSNGKHREETKQKISQTNKGKKRSTELRQKMSMARKGKPTQPCTEETRRKISEAQKGKKRGPINYIRKKVLKSEETKRKTSATLKGHPVSEPTRQKISAARKRKKMSDSTIQKMSERKKGKNWRINSITGKREWYNTKSCKLGR